MKKHFDFEKSKTCDSCSKCYKCVKACPVDAIKIEHDDVFESDELCIDCGICHKICHKDIHLGAFDIERFEYFLKDNKTIILLDTTAFMDLKGFNFPQLEEALALSGLNIVETGFDGIAIHDYLVDKTYKESNEFNFNTNCVPFMKYVKKFYPDVTNKILPYKTATEISAMLKKEKYGKDYKVVLVTGCFGDYEYVDRSPNIDYAILISELIEYIRYKGIAVESIIKEKIKRKEPEFHRFSSVAPSTITGFDNCKNLIEYASKSEISTTSPLRFFICSGGCFNSSVFKDSLTPFEREQVYSKFLDDNFDFVPMTEDEFILKVGDIGRFKEVHSPEKIDIETYSEQSISAVLSGISISKDMPEYDCGSCGYSSCKNFSIAILNGRATVNQCVPYINSINDNQSKAMEKMLDELSEAFSLTIPDNRLEKKLRGTPEYVGIYDNETDYIEITGVIKEGLYVHIINCLKISADLKNRGIFDLIGIDKNTLVQSILYHCNAKTQPRLNEGDVVKYSDLFEDKKEEASRSALFAKKCYNVPDSVCSIIKYHKHDEDEIGTDFPRHLLYVFRLFKIIDSISSVITKSSISVEFEYEFKNFILYLHKTKNNAKTRYSLDLYRKIDFNNLLIFLKA